MSEPLKPAVLDGGKAVGICAALGGAIGIIAIERMPVEAVAYAMLLLPFLPIPVALLTARHGVMTGTVAGLAIGSLCTTWTVATGSSAGLLVFLFAGVAGIFAGAGFCAGVTIYRMLVMIMLLFLGMIMIWFGTYLLENGSGPVPEVESFADSLAADSGGFYESVGIAEGRGDEISATLREQVVRTFPALLLIFTGLMSIVTVAFSRFVFNSAKQPFPPDIRFSELRLHFGFVYIFIAALAFLLAAYGLDGEARDWSETVGDNLRLVALALFFIQGLAIAAWFMQKRKLSGPRKVGAYLILGILEWMFSLVSFVGIFDVFVDFRGRSSGNDDVERKNQ